MPERQCQGCTRRQEWGCTAFQWREPDVDTVNLAECWVNPAVLPLKVDGEETYACPRQSLRENPAYWHRILLYYGMYCRGFLPGEGAVMAQSNKAIEIFRLLDTVNRECDAELDRRAAGKRGREKGMPGFR